MMLWSWLIPAALLVLLIVLLIKIYLLEKSADEIGAALTERLETETNTLIDISSRDRHMQRLADGVNSQLRLLREQRRRYTQGDAELKNAVTGVSHDLRTPLTALSGYLELLEKEQDPEKRAHYMAIVKNRVELMTGLTEELFQYSVDVSAEERLKPERLSLNAVLEESVAAFYTALSSRGIEPEILMPEEPVYCVLDREALLRVFGNILGNAVKYSEGDLKIELLPDASLCFSNRASGLDSVQTQRLFDRFYTVESARRSTGLGLSIAKLLTERMGGSIRAEYTEGRLAIFLNFQKETN